MEENSVEITPKQENKFLNFIKNHKLVTFFLLTIIVLISYVLIKVYKVENKAKFEINKNNLENIQIIENLNNIADSLLCQSYTQTTEALSIAIANELSIENEKKINYLLNMFIQDNNVQKIFIVNVASIDNLCQIIYSTDMKDINKPFLDFKMLKNETIKNEKNNFIQIISPVKSNQNKTKAFLIIEFNKFPKI
ncbi:MAG: hypothetical protein LBV69_01840 [Bacteroidales bacterium]|nr:hypothetical protein [Bacteroidales bacterium]